MGRISQRIGSIEPSATVSITTKAKAMRAAGEPVIGFGAGEPDFPTPDYIVDAAVSACRDPKNHKYSAAAGLPEFREAIAAKTLRDSGLDLQPDQVLVTNGGKMAVFEAFATLLDPGDEVLMPAPYWVTYPEAIRMAGGVPVAVQTDASTGFKATINMLEAHCTPATKVLLFVSPSNPTGAVYTAAETKAIGEWAAARGFWVLTDEIYEHLVYGDAEFSSMPALVPDIRDRCVIVNGVAKTYSMTGWRVGWMAGPADIVKAASNMQTHATSNVDNIAQRAALAAVSGPLDDVYRMRAAFDRRRMTMVSMLNSIDGVACLEPHGAFYAFPNFEGVLGRTFDGRTPETTLDLAAVLLDLAQVAVVPGEAFGAPGHIRMSYALSDADLIEGIERMARLLN